MTNYTKSTNFASKDSLAVGNPLKIVKGTEIDTEFNNIASASATKADLTSPMFVGSPSRNANPPQDDSSFQLATTNWVQNELATEVIAINAAKAPKESPTFTGVPAAPTAAVDTDTTQLATTAFVVAQAATVAPLANGTAAVGTSKKYARQDHKHPPLLSSGSSVYAASGTSLDITGIPSWAYRVTVTFKDVSTNGTSIPLIQLITSSAVTSGYTSSGSVIATGVASSTSTAGFLTAGGSSDTATTSRSGQVVITYQGVFQYAASSVLACNVAETRIGGGSILLSALITGVRITTVNGTDVFDAGSISILYE
jgi:hypothetical protein